MKEMKRKNHMEQTDKSKEQEEHDLIDLPDNPKTGKPYTSQEIAKVLLSTKPKFLDDWREKKQKE